ncbi:glycosyl transferase [Bacteroidia bacterium]|nr:glycosyl transferase [Bacteroidia bacterium]
MKKLSIIIPAYNEGKTIISLLQKVVNVSLIYGIQKEIVIVNDCSQDATAELVKEYLATHADESITLVQQEKNQGKGAAIRKGLEHITGDYIIIQDADLEYEPEDYNILLEVFVKENRKVLYGSRFLNSKNRHSYQSFYIGGRLVTLFTNLLFCQHLTDEPTCYKLFDAAFLRSIFLRCDGFEFCPEVTAKVAKRGIKIKEVPINYYPRSIEDGKKIKWTDGLAAIWALIKYRFVN